MEQDLQLREAARAVYDACYLADEGALFSFDEAERFRTVHYRQAVGAAQAARSSLAAPVEPPLLLATLRTEDAGLSDRRRLTAWADGLA